MKFAPVLFLLPILLLASCHSTIPTAADMDRCYQIAERRALERIGLLDDKLARGEISQAEHDRKADEVRAAISSSASEMAWSRHALVEAQKVSQGVPTGDHPVNVGVPGRGGSGGFYRPAGSTGAGYQGASAFAPMTYQPGSMVESMRPSRGY